MDACEEASEAENPGTDAGSDGQLDGKSTARFDDAFEHYGNSQEYDPIVIYPTPGSAAHVEEHTAEEDAVHGVAAGRRESDEEEGDAVVLELRNDTDPHVEEPVDDQDVNHRDIVSKPVAHEVPRSPPSADDIFWIRDKETPQIDADEIEESESIQTIEPDDAKTDPGSTNNLVPPASTSVTPASSPSNHNAWTGNHLLADILSNDLALAGNYNGLESDEEPSTGGTISYIVPSPSSLQQPHDYSPMRAPSPPLSTLDSPPPSPDPPSTPPRRSLQPGTLPARPVSMFESPHRGSLTSDAQLFFVPPPDAPRLPQSPEETEFGTITLHRSAHSLSSRSRYAEPNLRAAAGTRTFSAVVHGRVTELPAAVASSSGGNKDLCVPSTPRGPRRETRQTPLSPGAGDLAALLANAALLEERLLEGELPSEAALRLPVEVEAPRPSSPIDEGKWRPMEMPHVRHEEPSIRPKHTFRNPLGRSKSVYSRESAAYSPSSATAMEGHSRSRSSTIQEQSPPAPQSKQSPRKTRVEEGQTIQRPPHAQDDDSPPTPPPKSSPASARYLSGLRRLASTSRSSMHGAYPRYSVSTSSELSSEDSMLVVTPPDRSPDFSSAAQRQQQQALDAGLGPGGVVVAGAAGVVGAPGLSKTGSVLWPSLSSKKSIGSLSRATSFAEKMWHRSRSKSSVSVASTDEMAG